MTTFLGSYENIVTLFNPRLQNWNEHFKIAEGEMIHKSQIGEATIKLLKLNEPERVSLRKFLGVTGI